MPKEAIARPRRSGLVGAAVAYVLLAVVMTWPLAPGMLNALPSDLGDPVLNCWILARNAQWLTNLLSGGLPGAFWDGRIFNPAPLTMAYSDHLVPESLQALPLYAATGNVVFAYNVLLLSTYGLSAFGMFLLVRTLTGHTAAAFLAGLFFGFTPYRVDQVPHLQVLSSQWMPFALLGLRHFIASGKPLPLVGAVAALVAQGLSCGYYLLYFLPVAFLFAAFELVRTSALREPRRALGLALAAATVAAITVPFLLPYQEVHKSGVLVRPRVEVERFSADVLSSLTAPEGLRLWGGVLTGHSTTTEGTLFLGFVPLAFAAAAGVAAWRRARAAASAPPRIGLLIHGAARSETVFFLAAAVLCWVLALGPTIRFRGEVLGPGLYALLYEHVPGFDGLRVPARFTMIVALFVSILAGKGAAAFLGRDRRGTTVAAGFGLLFLLEAAAMPLETHKVANDPALRPLVGRAAPFIYRQVADLSPQAVLVELPIVSDPDELRAMVPALQHRRRLVNGYSGLSPAGYLPLRPAFVLAAPDQAWTALEASGATHVLVHERAWTIPEKGRRVTRCLEARGAKVLAREKGDVLLTLPPRDPGPPRPVSSPGLFMRSVWRSS